MWPLGHAAVAYLCYTAWTRLGSDRHPDHVPVIIVIFASQFPDLVDKPLAWYVGALPTGRTLAHSLLVLVPLCIAIYLVSHRYDRTAYGIAFAIGAISHAIVDALPALWSGTDPGFLLWPIISVEPYENGPPTIMALLEASLGNPYFYSEFVLAAMAVVAWRADGYPGLAPFKHQFHRLHARLRV